MLGFRLVGRHIKVPILNPAQRVSITAGIFPRDISWASTTTTLQQHYKMASTEASTPPALTHVLETCLYVKDMQTAAEFYENKLGLKPYLRAVCS